MEIALVFQITGVVVVLFATARLSVGVVAVLVLGALLVSALVTPEEGPSDFGYQTRTMVDDTYGYRFADFLKVGLPPNFVFWALAVYFIPKFWAF